MHKLSIDDMMSGKESRYSLVIAVAKRAREITDEALEKEIILDEKPVKMAIRDLEEGKYDILAPDKEDLQNENPQYDPSVKNPFDGMFSDEFSDELPK